MSNVIYLITDPNKKTYPHKVGKHTGTLKDLKSRYRTYHPNHLVLLFIETSNAPIIEDRVKEAFYYYREVNDKGNRSEWLNCDIDLVKNYILEQCIVNTKEYSWSYNILCYGKYNSMKAMKFMIGYIRRTYKNRYDSSNNEHGYSLSKDKIIALCYACYNIIGYGKEDFNRITYEGIEEYEKHVRNVIGY